MIEVGPSAAPITAIDAAFFRSKPSNTASSSAAKMPNCAPAPNKNRLGFARSGPKSIIAPIPINNKIGIASETSIPVSNSH